MLDGRVDAITAIGRTIVIAGTFTQVANPGSSVPLSRLHIAAFDRSTGQLLTGFAPRLTGTVSAVQPGPDGRSVLVAESFGRRPHRNRGSVLRLSLATGRGVRGFAAPRINGAVNTMAVHRGRLYIGGVFTQVDGRWHRGIAALRSVSGTLVRAMQVQLSGYHGQARRGTSAGVGARSLDVSPDGSRLVVDGNFMRADGLPRPQLAMITLGRRIGVTRSWATGSFTRLCLPKRFDAYVRQVAFAPNGRYFVVTTSGGSIHGLCDSASRWETRAVGTRLLPTWVAPTGQDTLLSVAISGSAVYVGGHQRWLNNPEGANVAGAGAVPRPGLAALDPGTGLPLTWNPGRNPRGYGTAALLLTRDGLWVGSDTQWIGNRRYLRPRLALLPAPGGSTLPRGYTGALPDDVYLLGATRGGQVQQVRFNGSRVRFDRAPRAFAGMDWSGVRGAFMVDKTLYYGWTNGRLYQRPFYGSVLGGARLVDPYHDPAWDNVQTGSGQTYAGRYPMFYRQIPQLTSLSYNRGRLYYTMARSCRLYERAFSVDSGVMAAIGTAVPSAVNWRNVAGSFISGRWLYFSTRAGVLHRVAFHAGRTLGRATVVRTGGVPMRWAARGMVLFAGAAPGTNRPPVASFTADCAGAQCSFDAGASHDPDGIITSYRWDFGDGTAAATGAHVVHGYADSGTYTVRLTVTDDDRASVTSDQKVSPLASSIIGFVGSTSATASTSPRFPSATVTVPAGTTPGDTMVLVVSSGVATPQPTVTGWSLAGTKSTPAMESSVWYKPATSNDTPGSAITVGLAGTTAKSTLDVATYSGVNQGNPLTPMAWSSDTVATTNARTARLGVDADGWVLTYWAGKSSSSTAWLPPSEVAQRESSIGSGGGNITSLLADSGAVVPAETYPAREATRAGALNSTITLVLGLRPAPTP